MFRPGKRTTPTAVARRLPGQPAVSHGYDDAHRLTSVTQGTQVVALTYDDADRRHTLTLPNGIVTTYTWDAASQLTGLTYTNGNALLGTLTYTYDTAGNRTSVGGTWARTGLPQPITATYDAANRLMQWGASAPSYDLNGNLANDGTTTYTWNARNQLTGLSGAASARLRTTASAGAAARPLVGRRRSSCTTGRTSCRKNPAAARRRRIS